MVRIAPIRLNYNPKTLWFDSCDLDIRKGDAVVVSTARGVEFGRAADDVFEADDNQVKKLKTSLKPVKRFATDEDVARNEDMQRKSEEALPVFKEMAAAASDDMRPVSVEFLLDGDKAVFYFEAEERVDFRDLVRKLAARFRVRIDMRQIGVRDEARMVGGLGHCGQELCCKRLGGEFCPVSIRMAKEQDLSLNPQKISGVCGRLMCCLRYEFDAYKEFKSRAPKQNAQIKTPDGMARVIHLDVPREIVSLKIEGEKAVDVFLSDMESDEDGTRPNRIDAEAWEQAKATAALGVAGEINLLTPQFDGQEKLADPAGARRTVSGGKQGSKSQGGTAKGTGAVTVNEGRKPRRRRSTKVGASEAGQGAASGEGTQGRRQKGVEGSGQQKKQGQKKTGQGNRKKASGMRGKAPASAQDTGRKQGTKNTQGGAKTGPRPGQKSSGLHQKQMSRDKDGSPPSRGMTPNTHQHESSGEDGHRRARRRSHKAGGPQGGQGDTDAKNGSQGGSREA